MTASRQAGLARANGIWYQYGGPQAIQVSGKTFWGWVNVEGDIRVASYDHTNGAVVETVISAGLCVDDHAPPSLLIRSSDGRVLVFYTMHGGADIWWKISVNPYDISSFGAEKHTTTARKHADYLQPVVVPSESKIFLFYRAVNNTLLRSWNFMVSTDDGDTFGNEAVLRHNFNPTDQYIVNPYTIPISDGVSKIHFLTFEYRQIRLGGMPHSICHFYYDDGKLFKSDGTYVKDMGDAIHEIDEVTVVDPRTGVNIWDIALDDNGYPVVVYVRFENYINDHQYRYARWNGTQWNHYEIVSGGGPIAEATGREWYSGGICLNRNNPSIVYASCEVEPRIFEIFEYITSDWGENWQFVKKYVGNPNVKNFRPQYPRNADEEHIKLFFISGDYKDLREYGPCDILCYPKLPFLRHTITTDTYEEIERRLRIAEEKLKIEGSARMHAEQNYLRTKKAMDVIRTSTSYQLGSTLVQAIRKPGYSTLMLPYRLTRLFWKALKKITRQRQLR